MLPILKARPPIAMRIDINVPSPLKISLATSCPRLPVTTSTRQILICAPISINIDSKIANAKLDANCAVNTAVCVKNAGPIITFCDF